MDQQICESSLKMTPRRKVTGHGPWVPTGKVLISGIAPYALFESS